MDKEKQKEATYTFLKDEPLGEDLFKSKAQEKIVEVLKENIINNDEINIIGIDGEWGSGKSNLVRNLEIKLDSDREMKGKYKFFIYDVWGHQEDDQRRAILEGLTDFIIEENLVNDEEKWKKKYKDLLTRVKETHTRRKPVLSLGLVISLLFILFTPLLDAIGNDIMGWRKYVIYSLPFIVLFFYYMILVISYACQKQKHPFKRACLKIFEVYNRDKIEENFREYISDETPSVKEFRKWIEEINNDLDVRKDNLKKFLIIVFDNFDRLPQKHILSLWSSIHVFFAEQKYKRTKVILPFDRAHISHAFKDLNREVVKENSKINSLSESNTFGDDYINKTFDIVFRVPAPIMSDWKEFFRDKWVEAFGNKSEELDAVILVYEFLSDRKTPREIIAFINEVITYKLINEEYGERYIAIFILRKARILNDSLNSINTLDYLGGLDSLYKNDESFSKQITAICYGIEPKGALELIYSQKLEEALNKNDYDNFKELIRADFVSDIFIGTLKKINLMHNAILVLDKTEQEGIELPHSYDAWRMIYYSLNQNEPSNQKIAFEGWQIILAKKAPDNTFLKKILSKFTALLRENGSMKDFLQEIEKLPENLNNQYIFELLEDSKVKPDQFLFLINHKGKGYNKYKVSCEEKELDNYLNKMNVEALAELENTQVLFANFKLPEYIERLKAEIKSDSISLDLKDKILKQLKGAKISKETLKNLLTTAQITNYYQHAEKSTDLIIKYDLIALRLLYGNDSSNAFRNVFESVLNPDETKETEELVKNVSDAVLNYTGFNEFIVASVDPIRQFSLLRQVILVLLKSERDEQDKIDVAKILEKDRYRKLKDGLKLDEDEFLNYLNNENYSFDNLASTITKIDAQFIQDCLSGNEETSKLKISKDFKKAFNESFFALEDDKIEKVFKDKSSIYNNYFSVLEPKYLKQSTFNIFKQIFLEHFQHGSLSESLWKVLSHYSEKKPSFTIKLLEDIRDSLTASRYSIDYLDTMKILPFFFKHDTLANEENTFRRIIKSEFLKEHEFIQFLMEHAGEVKIIFDEADKIDKEAFINVINERLTEDIIISLADLLGITKD